MLLSRLKNEFGFFRAHFLLDKIIARKSKTLIAQYEYDSFGKTTVRDSSGSVNTNESFIGNINPFRWKSFYYDVETGFYYANGRYYEVEGTPKSWWKKHWWEVLVSAVNIVVGVVKLATGNVTGILNIISGISTLVGAIFSEQLAGAMGTAMLGVQTIMIGAQSLACNPVHGIIAMAVGAACVAFATAEAQESLGYGNWLKDTVGMSDKVYKGVMVAVNVAAIAINIVGVKQCFKEGTLVACLNENGEEIRKPIESIAVGTFVLAYDEETGEKAYKPVVQLSRNTTKEWYHIRMNGEEIVCTGGHPFYVLNVEEDRKVVRYEGVSPDKNGRWIEAKELKTSDKLLLSDGTCAIIENIKVEQLSEPETTYNFEVEDFHTYYVSDSNVLVHNRCVAKDGDYQAVVNEFNEKEAPHAHILKNRQRVAVVDSNGNIIKGAKQRGVVQFVLKHKDEIVSGIKKFYPRR